MSSPLLATSPTVRLQVNSDRELEADVVLAAPNVNNALRITEDGLYVKRGVRTNPWNVQRLPPYSATASLTNATQTNQSLVWGSENLDPDGLVDLVAQPTRITATAAGYYWSRPYIYIASVGENTAAARAVTAQMVTLKNGTTWVAGTDVYWYSPIATQTAFQLCGPSYVHLEAGDYLEIFWRWVLLELNTATSWSWQGQWAGGRIAA